MVNSYKNIGFLSIIFIFVIVNVLVVNGIFFLFEEGSSFSDEDSCVFPYSSATLFNNAQDIDSWGPMYKGLKSIQSGIDPTIYQINFFEKKDKFQYPPSSLLIIEGIQQLNNQKEGIYAILNLISWICVIGTIFFTMLIFFEGINRYVPEEYPLKKWMYIILILILGFTFYPILRSYYLGQIQTWLTFLFTMSLWLWLRNRQAVSGFCLGLVSIIKPHMVLFLLWGMLRRYWKFCIMFTAVAAGFLIISIWHYGLPAHVKYVEVLSYLAERGEAFFPNQSINGLMNRLLFNGNNLFWDYEEFVPNQTVRIVTILTSIVLILGVLFIKFKLPQSESWLGFVTAGLVFTIASPIAWEHHYGILLPIYALVLPKAWSLREQWKSGLLWLIISYILTANRFNFTNLTAFTHWNFVQSYLFFGALILLFVLIKIQIMSEQKLQLELI